MKRNVFYFAAIIVMFITLSYGCSSKTATKPSTTPIGATTVSIQNFAFAPDTVIVKTGSTVTWTNEDSAPHTVTDLGGAFGSASIATNSTFKFTFATAGTFTYHCTIHPMMKKAVVIVSN